MNYLVLKLTLTLNENSATINTSKLQFNIHRKATFTGSTIHGDSLQSATHEASASPAIIHQLLYTSLNQEDFENEVTTIKHIAEINKRNNANKIILLHRKQK